MLALAVDDSTAELLAAAPVPGPARLTLRTGAAAIVVGLGIGGVLAAVAAGPGLPPGGAVRLAEGVAAATIGLATGLVLLRRGVLQSGPAGVAAGLLIPATATMLAHRWPTWFPSLVPGPAHHRWWALSAVAMLVTLRAGRDAGRR